MTFRQAVDRYGIAAGVIIALVLALIILPGNATSDRLASGRNGDNGVNGSGDQAVTGAGGDIGGTGSGTDTGAAGSGATGAGGAGGTGSGSGGTSGGTGGGGGGGGTGTTLPGATKAAGVTFGSGPHCRSDGRQIGISYAMPPCANWTPGSDNGGATGNGVTRDSVTVVRYISQIDPATRLILKNAQLSDDPSVVKRAFDAIFRYGNGHYETYGREVKFVDVNASGSPTSDEVGRADAIKIAGMKPFAVIEGDPAQAANLRFIKEIALHNIPCFCSTSEPSSFYTSLPPIVFSPLPTLDEYAQVAGEYICKHLKNTTADFGGVGTKGKPRTFGLLYINGQNGVVFPELAQTNKLAEAALAKCGLTFAKEVSYTYDPGRNQTLVTNMIAQMKAAGVTTIVPFWDPLYPILITQEATKQVYFPEWYMSGTGLSDTTTAGRLYDKQQWPHAFGVSPLWVTWTSVPTSPGYKMYHWAFPDSKPGDEGVLINIYTARIGELFTAIHMAGPNLNNDTLTAGEFAYPRTGGSAARPLIYRTRQYPTAVKDYAEVFFDASLQGPDERGNQGSGMVVKADGAKRYQIGQWYTGPPKVFQPGGLTVSDNPPGGGDFPDSDPSSFPPSKKCLSCV